MNGVAARTNEVGVTATNVSLIFVAAMLKNTENVDMKSKLFRYKRLIKEIGTKNARAYYELMLTSTPENMEAIISLLNWRRRASEFTTLLKQQSKSLTVISKDRSCLQSELRRSQ